MSLPPERQEILIECVNIGAALRVAAVNATTGLEVSFQVPARTGAEEIRRLAAAKLRYVAERRKGRSSGE